ncbi:MAG: Spy/CpxP family protein refolding chaperone [Bacteroidales bacterium]
MDIFHKNRLIFWVLVILVIINVTALVSFFLFSKPQPQAPCCSPAEQQCVAFRDQLNLTAEQTGKVSLINENYEASAGPTAAAIKSTRDAILTELEKELPDTMQIASLIDRLAGLQVSIQKDNIKQYSELKKVCTPEQAQRLSALYRDLYGCPMQKNRMQNRYRGGH